MKRKVQQLMEAECKEAQEFIRRCSGENDRGCWIWTKSIKKNGYGRCARFRMRYAHRLAFIAFKGPIPAGFYVCHVCDVKACVNPEHLWLGTNSENATDSVLKGKWVNNKGEMHGCSKLTEKEVKEILHLSAEGFFQKELAEKFGVSRRCIGMIIRGDRWKHIEKGDL